MTVWSKVKVEDENIEDFLTKFVAAHPPPTDENGKSMAPLKWWRLWNRTNNLNAYRQGKKKLASVEVNEDIVTQG
ncbi:MAG: hypothetical protein ACYSW3_27985 [Planctomycetota bacterium]|jgi:hypothetical protein